MEEFEEIYRTYFSGVWRYLLKLTGDESLAEEITAETFFRAMNAMKSFRHQSSLYSWLCAIGRNIYLDQMRERKKRAEITDTAMMRIPDPRDRNEEAQRHRQAEEILSAAGRLKEPYRTVFLLRYIEQQSFAEIASRYGRTENWACVTCHRAREMVKKEMTEYEE
jgi:RNA polymerase sigma-70 factor (ECF subfamily)